MSPQIGSPQGHGGAASAPGRLQASSLSFLLDRKWLWVTIGFTRQPPQASSEVSPTELRQLSFRQEMEPFLQHPGLLPAGISQHSEGHGHIGRYKRLHKKSAKGNGESICSPPQQFSIDIPHKQPVGWYKTRELACIFLGLCAAVLP